MNCPRCKLVNPPTAKRCDCGYDFETQKVAATFVQGVSRGRSNAWSLKVTSAAEARRATRDSAIGFYVLAGIQALAALLLGPSILVDAALLAVLALWLHRRQSRVAATLLLLLAVAAAVTTLMNRLGQPVGGGTNVVLAAIAVWAGLKAVVATYKLPALRALEESQVRA